MAAEFRCSAAFDRRHHFQLPEAQMALVSHPVLSAPGTEDVGDLKRRSSHAEGTASPLARCSRLRGAAADGDAVSFALFPVSGERLRNSANRFTERT
jgi:hypothetical protein